jgi:hypothetical protein
MPQQSYYAPLVVDIADGTQVLNTTTETILFPDYTFAANDPLIRVGSAIRIQCYFDMSFVITSPGTVTMRVRWGGSGGTVLAATGAYAPDPTAALANRSGKLEALIVVRSIGTAGSMFCMGTWTLNDYDDATVTTLQGNLAMGAFGSAGANTPAVVASLDTTTAKALSVTVQHSVATATTQTTGHLRIVESLQ